MAKRRKGERRRGTCVYCGNEGEITSDHIFPRVVFPTQPHNHITLPVCDDCNQKKSRGDLDLLKGIVIDASTSHHPNYRRLMARLFARARDEPSLKQWLETLTDESRPVTLTDLDGRPVEEQYAVPFKDDHLIESLCMVARGLFYMDRGERVPLEVPSFAHRIPMQISIDLVQAMRPHAAGAVQERGENNVWWFTLNVEQITPYDGCWMVCFLDGLLFQLATGTYATSIDRMLRTHRQAAMLTVSRTKPETMRAATGPDGIPIVSFQGDSEWEKEFWNMLDEEFDLRDRENQKKRQ